MFEAAGLVQHRSGLSDDGTISDKQNQQMRRLLPGQPWQKALSAEHTSKGDGVRRPLAAWGWNNC